MSEKIIAWVHGDNLHPNQEALQYDAPAIWVWDEALLEEWDLSLKRIVFIYESLLELPVTIRKGDVAEEIVKFASQHDATKILVSNSPSPRFDAICQRIRETSGLEIEIFEPVAFVPDDDYKLGGFFSYWNTAKQYAFIPTDER